MYTLVVFAALFAAAVADPKPSVAEVVSVQQDTLGNYNLFQYTADGGVSRVERRNWEPITTYAHVQPYPILRAVEEHRPILRNVELAHVPLTRTLEIPQVPLVKSSLIATTPLLRVGAIPESPEILDLESRQFAHHVALQTHHLI